MLDDLAAVEGELDADDAAVDVGSDAADQAVALQPIDGLRQSGAGAADVGGDGADGRVALSWMKSRARAFAMPVMPALAQRARRALMSRAVDSVAGVMGGGAGLMIVD